VPGGPGEGPGIGPGRRLATARGRRLPALPETAPGRRRLPALPETAPGRRRLPALPETAPGRRRLSPAAGDCPGPPETVPGRLSRHVCHARPSPSRDPEWFVRLPWRIGLVRSIGATGWAFQNKVWLRRVRGPRCRLVAPCGSGQPAAMRFARFAASCPRGYRVDGAIVLVLCGPTAHRPASGGRDPVRKTADLAYNGRNSPARRELKLFRDVYPVAPILRNSPILRVIGTGGAGGRKTRPCGTATRPEPGSCGTPAPGRASTSAPSTRSTAHAGPEKSCKQDESPHREPARSDASHDHIAGRGIR
jgi:hypothetical protein